jgi:hypothetical protein
MGRVAQVADGECGTDGGFRPRLDANTSHGVEGLGEAIDDLQSGELVATLNASLACVALASFHEIPDTFACNFQGLLSQQI